MQNKLLILHGALGSSEQFKGLEDYFPGFELFIPDLPGHGQLAWQRSDFTTLGFSNFLNRYVKKNNLIGCNVFAFSMGGFISLYSQALQGNIFSDILTLATKFNWNPEVAKNEIKFLFPEKIEEKVPHYAEYLKYLHGEKNWEFLLSNHRRYMLSLGNYNNLNNYLLNKIESKVTLMIGEEDNMVSVDETKRTASQINNSRLKILPNIKHPIEKIEKEQLSELIKENLNL